MWRSFPSFDASEPDRDNRSRGRLRRVLGRAAAMLVGSLLFAGILAQWAGSVVPLEAQARVPDGPAASPGMARREAGVPGGPGDLRRDPALERTLAVTAAASGLRSGACLVDPVTCRFASVRGDEPFAAASTIKIPIAVELLRRADAGWLSLDEKLPLRLEDIGGGSGHLQYLKPGTVFSLRRVAELMIRRSDNTATNMIIARLGGPEAVNSSFEALSLARTRVRALLPDMEGTNTTSPRDLAVLLWHVDSGRLLSAGARDLLLGWMRRSHVKSLLPAGLGPGAVCYNKTGDIPGALGDAGVVVRPGGRRYIAAIQVERPRNSRRANELIRSLSRTAYTHLL